MADSPIERQVARLRTTYAQSALRRFLTWWGRELKPFVPARVREALVDQREEVLVRGDGGDLVVSRRGADPARAVRVARTEPEDVQRETVERELARSEERPALVFCIAPHRVLTRTLNLPLAAEENLRQVLAFEMDRQTPFRADQVYFDFRVARRDPVAKQLVVELAIVPKPIADAELAALAPTATAPDILDAAHGDGRLGFNLLPPEARASRPNVWLRVNLALGLAVAGLVVLAMVQSLGNREAALEALRAETVGQSRDAKSVAQLRTALNDAIGGANFLVQRKKERPPVVDILLDVSRRLPDDTWLQRFSVNRNDVQLQGQAREASSLIALLQASPVLQGPAMQGGITPDARTGKEQFLIAATAKLPGAEPPPPAGPASEKNDASTAQR